MAIGSQRQCVHEQAYISLATMHVLWNPRSTFFWLDDIVTERTALLVAAVTSLTWGLTGIFVRRLPSFSPLTITTGRLLIGLAAAIPLLLALGDTRRGVLAALKQPVAYLLALLLAGYYLLATAAFQMAPVADVALLISTTPLFVLAIRWLRGRPPARAEIGGALLAMGGMAVILAPRMSFSVEAPVHQVYGHFFAICAAALTAIYASIYQIVSERNRAPDASGVSVLTFALGSAILISMLALTPSPSGLPNVTGSAVLTFLALGVLSTAIPTFGFAIASKRLPPIVTATISLFVPPFAGLFAFLILGEAITALFLFGCVLVLGGVAMIIRTSLVR